MADPIRKQILDALDTALTAIANRITVATVHRGAKPWDEIAPADMPWVGIVPQRAQPTDQMGWVDYEWTIDLLVHQMAAAKTDAEISIACDNARMDIRKAIYETANLGVDGVIWAKMGPDESSEGAPEATAEARASSLISIIVKYQEAITS